MNTPTATLLDRTKSSAIDTLLLIATAFIIAGILDNFENVPTWLRALLFILLFLYEPVCITYGATIGNHIMNIRIRKSADEAKRINIFRSLLRFCFKLLLGWFSYITVLKNPRKRTLHDLISGSSVIDLEVFRESHK